MENVKFIQVETLTGFRDYALIDKGNDEFVTMFKEDYENMVANQKAPEESGTL